MKKLIALTFVTVGIGLSAHAQWEVYDPTVHLQLITDTGEELAKYVDMINNQVSQIQTLTSQLNEFKHYEDLFGDPKAVVLPTAQALLGDLRRTEPGQNLENLLKIADGAYALTNNAAGIYQIVGATFVTPGGQKITRAVDEYRSYAAISRTADNYVAVAADAASRRTAIKTEIAQTTQQLQNAQTDAEVQKLNGVLVGLSADLASADHEVNQALASALVQDIQNRNDEKKQIEARKEQQHAEFTETLSNYGKTFHLLADPVKFPVR
ncbi:MAG: hypothetical protein KGS61_17450 [Verrucomicrobia bacterium]|nr:hypothetical protein [Verrucomicrobiota bacterium]